jgi:hypothetical protein
VLANQSDRETKRDGKDEHGSKFRALTVEEEFNSVAGGGDHRFNSDVDSASLKRTLETVTTRHSFAF